MDRPNRLRAARGVGQLHRFLATLQERQPHVRARATAVAAPEAELRRGELDLAIFPSFRVVHLQAEPLFPGELLAALLPATHPLATKRVLEPDDLRGETLVVSPRAANGELHDRLLELIENAGYRFREVHDADGSTLRDLVVSIAQGAGVGLAPISGDELGEMRTIVVWRSLDPPLRMPGAVVAWRQNPPSQLRQVFATVRAIARELARESP